jgi:dihydroorotate dehydrogenase electron transfer subunit
MSTIHSVEATILHIAQYEGEQCIIRLVAPEIAKTAKPGSFIHIQCDPLLPLRRPISIMMTDPSAGTVDILFKIVGQGTTLLSKRQQGEVVSILGPIGNGFTIQPNTDGILIGGGVGMPPMVFLSLAMQQQNLHAKVFLGSEVAFPFRPTPSMLLNHSGVDVTATMPLLDERNIYCRLASNHDMPGVYQGWVTDLARDYLHGLGAARDNVVVYACGPLPMLQATFALAQEFALPCQVSLEEYMACGVGGCAGCVVKVREGESEHMRRVCVDGPVFDAYQVWYD